MGPLFLNIGFKSRPVLLLGLLFFFLGLPTDSRAAWDPLGNGPNGPVHALAIDGQNNLYAGGSFTTAGGVATQNVAKWTGTGWTALGSGVNDIVQALAVDGQDRLFAGGFFTHQELDPEHRVRSQDSICPIC